MLVEKKTDPVAVISTVQYIQFMIFTREVKSKVKSRGRNYIKRHFQMLKKDQTSIIPVKETFES